MTTLTNVFDRFAMLIHLFGGVIIVSLVAALCAAGCNTVPEGKQIHDNTPMPRVFPAPPPAALDVRLGGFTNGEAVGEMSLFGDIIIVSNMPLQPITNEFNPYANFVIVTCDGNVMRPVGWGINMLVDNRELVLGFDTHKPSDADCTVKLLRGFTAANGKSLSRDKELPFHTRTLADQFDRLGHKTGNPNRPRWWMVTRNAVSQDCNGFDVVKAVGKIIFIVCTGSGTAYEVNENLGDVGALNVFLGRRGDEVYVFTTGDEYTIE